MFEWRSLCPAERVFVLFRENRYGVHDGVIPACGRALGRKGLDGYIEAVRLGGAEDPWTLEIAKRLLGAGWAEEALGRLDAARVPQHRYGAWVDRKVRCLLALGRDGEAQALRLEAFGETLSTQTFRNY